jgi:hypothetical protein
MTANRWWRAYGGVSTAASRWRRVDGSELMGQIYGNDRMACIDGGESMAAN